MNIFTEYGIKAQIPEAHDLLFTDSIEIQGNTIGGGGTPETPIEIQSVGSPINITGKNLFNIEGQISSTPNAEKYNNGLRITKAGPFGGNSDNIPMSVPAGSYRLSYDIIEQTAKSILIRAFYIDNSTYNILSLGVCTFTKDVKSIQFYVNDTINSEVGKGYTIDNIQVERGTTKTEYEPYLALSIPIKDTIGNALTLHRLGTAYDSIYKGNGKWYANVKIAKATSNVTNAKPNSTYLGTTGNGTASVTGAITVTGEVVYELATPEIIELHEDTATALDNLAALNIDNTISTDNPAAVIGLSVGLTVSYGTSKRSNFKIPSIHNGKTVTRIEVGGFSGNNNLTYLYIPESIKELGDRALNNNINLKDIYINRLSILGITTCGTNMFDNCPKLTNIYVPTISVTAYRAAPNWTQYASKIKAL